MTPENEKRLLATFPRLYRARFENSEEVALRHGFEIDDGWFDLVWRLSEKIDDQARREGRSGEDWPMASQVKEKFGGLRFYARGISAPMREIIDVVEKGSFKTCESCGAPGQTYRADGRILTRCELCAARIRKEQSPRFWARLDKGVPRM